MAQRSCDHEIALSGFLAQTLKFYDKKALGWDFRMFCVVGVNLAPMTCVSASQWKR